MKINTFAAALALSSVAFAAPVPGDPISDLLKSLTGGLGNNGANGGPLGGLLVPLLANLGKGGLFNGLGGLAGTVDGATKPITDDAASAVKPVAGAVGLGKRDGYQAKAYVEAPKPDNHPSYKADVQPPKPVTYEAKPPVEAHKHDVYQAKPYESKPKNDNHPSYKADVPPPKPAYQAKPYEEKKGNYGAKPVPRPTQPCGAGTSSGLLGGVIDAVAPITCGLGQTVNNLLGFH
ncbi:hypothetical protein GGI12_002538 [Dipsacomyces acuminosporus]|nr:hypothetical protein GGI12_002538 [Dipsacomyces acuminosporus]